MKRTISAQQDDAGKDWSNGAKLAAVAGALAACVSLLPSDALAVSGGGGKPPTSKSCRGDETIE